MMTDIRDDKLFTQPDGSHHGECPICCLPLPLDLNKSLTTSCCSKLICKGCSYFSRLREKEQGLEHKCPYCREPVAFTHEENYQNERKRLKANDPVRLREVGKRRKREGDLEGAFEYLTKAAALGDIESHYELTVMYRLGEGVEKDMKNEVYHLEEAAIGGHLEARYNLAVREWNKICRREQETLDHRCQTLIS